MDDCLTQEDLERSRAAAKAAMKELRWRPSARDADDVESDAAFAMWRASLSWDGRHSRAQWLYRKATFGIIDGLRTRGGKPGSHRHRGQYKEVRLDGGSPLFPPAQDPENVEFLVEALSRGDERLRVICAGLAEGKTKQEVAEDLGVTPGRVSQLLHVIRKNYRKLEAA